MAKAREYEFRARHGERVKACVAGRRRQGRDPATGQHVRGARARYVYMPHTTSDAAVAAALRRSPLFARGVIYEAGPQAAPAVSDADLRAALSALTAAVAAETADIQAGFQPTVEERQP